MASEKIIRDKGALFVCDCFFKVSRCFPFVLSYWPLVSINYTKTFGIINFIFETVSLSSEKAKIYRCEN